MKMVILNPAYLLRQDGNRVILCSQQEERWEVDEWFSFIHPYHAQMFSFFKGQFSFKEELQQCADFFKLPIEKMQEIVAFYIDNTQSLRITSCNHKSVYFPKNVLVSFDKNNSLQRSTYYQTSDFNYIGEPDYTTLRLTYPINVNFELLMNCYVDCSYCYAKRSLATEERLETKEIVNFIRKCKKEGVLFLI